MKFKNFFQTVVISALLISICGCASDVPRMQKYDSQASYKPETAIIVVNTSNISYMDINKYSPDSFKHDNEFYNSTTSKTSPKGPLTQTPIPNRYEQEANSDREFKDGFDLRRLFGKKKQQAEAVSQESIQSEQVAATVTESPATQIAAENDRANNWRLYKPTLSIATPFNYSKAIYTVEPGIYYIAFAYYETNAVPQFTQDPGITQQGEIMYGAFEVKPGAVVYLGDIDFNWVTMNKSKRVNIINNLSRVQKDLISAGNTKLAQKLEVASFYPRGSKIVMSQQGEPQIISN